MRVEGAEVITGISLHQKIVNSANNVTAVYRIPAPAGGWNYLHSGAYTIVLNNRTVLDTGGRGPGGHNLKTYPGLFFTAPSARIAGSTTMTGNEWLIPIKFSGLNGIIQASITNATNLVTVSAPNGYSQTATRTQLIDHGDGSYTGIYKVTARGGFWDYSDNAGYTVRVEPGVVRDNLFRAAPGGNLRTFGLWFDKPAADIVGVTANQNDASRFEVVVRFHDNGAINLASITAGAVSVSGPTAVTTTLLSVTADPAGGYRARFRFTPATGDRLANGSYFVSTVANVVRDNGDVGINGGVMQRYGLWFAP